MCGYFLTHIGLMDTMVRKVSGKPSIGSPWFPRDTSQLYVWLLLFFFRLFPIFCFFPLGQIFHNRRRRAQPSMTMFLQGRVASNTRNSATKKKNSAAIEARMTFLNKSAGTMRKNCTEESRKDETCLQFKMNKHFIKTRKISQKPYPWRL